MSNLRKKVEIERIRRLIFEMISESDGVYPDQDALYTNQSYSSAKGLPQNKFDVTKLKSASKDPNQIVLNSIKKSEREFKKISLLVAINAMAKYLGEESKITIPSDIKRLKSLNTSIENDASPFDSFYKSKISSIKSSTIDKHNKTILFIGLSVIKRVIDTYEFRLSKKEKVSNLGGPEGNSQLEFFYDRQLSLSYKSEIDKNLENVLSPHIKGDLDRVWDNHVGRSDTILNKETFTEQIKYFYDVFSGRKGSSDFAISKLIINIVTTGGIFEFKSSAESLWGKETSSINYLTHFGDAVMGVLGIPMLLSLFASYQAVLTLQASLLILRIVFTGINIADGITIMNNTLDSLERIYKLILKETVSRASSSDVYEKINKVIAQDLSLEDIDKKIREIAKKESESLSSLLSNKMLKISDDYVSDYSPATQDNRSWDGADEYYEGKENWTDISYFFNEKINDEDIATPRDAAIFTKLIAGNDSFDSMTNTRLNQKIVEKDDSSYSDLESDIIQAFDAKYGGRNNILTETIEDIIFNIISPISMLPGAARAGMNSILGSRSGIRTILLQDILSGVSKVIDDDSYEIWENSIESSGKDVIKNNEVIKMVVTHD